MKKFVLYIILVMIASILVAVTGCTVNLGPTSSPSATSSSASPTAVSRSPVATNMPSSQPAGIRTNATIAIMTNVIRNSGGTITEPAAISINSQGNTVITLKAQSNTGQAETYKAEICKTSSATDTRFQATINDAKARGYSGDIGSNGYWNGVNTNTNQVIVISKNNDAFQITSIESSA